MKILLRYSAFVLSLILLTYCSELNDNIPSVPKVTVHGEGIYDTGSVNYHVNTVLASNNGIYDCQQCHAADFSGGIAGIGCNGLGCHPTIGVHKFGIVDPSSSEFHGDFIKNDGWNMLDCKNCHGETYEGGLASPSCRVCHSDPGGPENCSTCHGNSSSPAPPRDLNGNTSTTERGVGAHQVHLSGNSKGRTLQCTQCHDVPGSVYGVSTHIDEVAGAEVLMEEERANLVTNEPTTSEYDPTLQLFVPDPQYNISSLTCSNTYCHGYFKNGNLTNAPIWTDPSTSVCGTCHGDVNGSTLEEIALPKTSSEGGSHPDNINCSTCHGDVVDSELKFIDPSKHVDGKLNLFGNDIDF